MIERISPLAHTWALTIATAKQTAHRRIRGKWDEYPAAASGSVSQSAVGAAAALLRACTTFTRVWRRAASALRQSPDKVSCSWRSRACEELSSDT
eukprot:CAMPEP_0171599650 /NCGR_PEP_ID=MMETSP0990-20121206/3850_1 /TAXON_ID=483369 /ORGANISM="non described non described, Strain CCMP2098" /LENGTH=94 /DNA_ID=CAMNT_0012161449 /DNA_START=239 /DNA_END=523 /DNA_ORIENTATION=-